MKKVFISLLISLFLEAIIGVIFFNLSLSKENFIPQFSDIILAIGMAFFIFIVINGASYFMMKLHQLERTRFIRRFFLVASSILFIVYIFISFKDNESIFGVIFLIPILISCILWEFFLDKKEKEK